MELDYSTVDASSFFFLSSLSCDWIIRRNWTWLCSRGTLTTLSDTVQLLQCNTVFAGCLCSIFHIYQYYLSPNTDPNFPDSWPDKVSMLF